MIERRIRPLVVEALMDTRVVMVMGARQAGKSTLCEAIASEDHRATAVNLDDEGVRETARSDPSGFLAGFDGPVFIDEIQRAPELILAIKQVVDRAQRPGQFLLTGSANILSSRKVQRLSPDGSTSPGCGRLRKSSWRLATETWWTRCSPVRRRVSWAHRLEGCVRRSGCRGRLSRGSPARRPPARALVCELSDNHTRAGPGCDCRSP